MTQIRSMPTPNRRPGELGAHSLDHYALEVPDLADAETFYGAFGLDVKSEGRGLGIYTAGGSHCWGSFIEGPRKKLHHLSFGAFEDDMPRFRQRLADLRIERLEPPPGFESNGLWFRDPEGVLVEIKVAEKVSPDAKSTFGEAAGLPGIANAPVRKSLPKVRPRRLSHVLMFRKDVMGSIKFYHQALGLRLSDHSGDRIAFMHAIHGSDHHMIAMAKSDGPGFHHSSWDVGSINDIGNGAMQMLEKGFSKGWGLGRHVIGSNYFHYVQDPWGSHAEYAADIDYIPVVQDWQPTDYPPEDSLSVWGPAPPPEFIVNTEAATS